MVITAKCAHCGAQILFGETDEVTICKYCDSINAIQEAINKPVTNANIKSANDIKANSPIVLREVSPELTFGANYFASDVNIQGGHFWINKYEIYFAPHKFNIGNLQKRYMKINEICGFGRIGIDLQIHTTNGNMMTIRTWRNDRIIKEIETRRKSYFETRGLPIPELKEFEFCKLPESKSGKAIGYANKILIALCIVLGLLILLSRN